MRQFELILATPEKVLHKGPVWQISTVNERGWFTIRARHENFLTVLEPGPLEIGLTEDNRKRFTISGGLLQMVKNECTVLCESCSAT